jgi:hypothetical protein
MRIFLILLFLSLVSCQTKQEEKTNQLTDTTKNLSQQQNIDSSNIEQPHEIEKQYNFYFIEWTNETEKLVNQKIIKDTVIHSANDDGFVCILTLKNQKDSLLLVDITNYIDDNANNKKYLFKLEKDKWEKIEFYETTQPSVMPYQKSFELFDINFDGKKDVIFSAPVGSISRLLHFYQVFLKTNTSYKYHEFSPDKDYPKFFLFSAGQIQIDAVNKHIITLGDGGNFGTHSKDVLKWRDGRLIKIKSLEKIYSEKGFVMEEFTHDNQMKKSVKQWIIRNEEKADKYFENWLKTSATQVFEF